MVAKKRTYKLNLWPFLDSISYKNVKYYDGLTEENLKEFSPYVTMRWLTGSKDPDAARQLWFLNEFVNPYAFDLQKNHKRLLYNLMTACTNGKKKNYKFMPAKPVCKTEFPISVDLVQWVFDYSKRDSIAALVLLTDEDIIGMGEDYGLQKGEIAALKKELKKRK